MFVTSSGMLELFPVTHRRAHEGSQGRLGDDWRGPYFASFQIPSLETIL